MPKLVNSYEFVVGRQNKKSTNHEPRTTNHFGFTLIELLVVISIISILSVVGFVSYQNVTAKAKDAKMKADIDAIKKAYETNYDPSLNNGQGGYKALQDSNFASGKIPTQPNGSPYPAFLGPGSTDGSNSLPGLTTPTSAAYKVCATLSNNTSTCASSTQGDTTLVTQVNSLINPTCDPTGSLALGLVGYWKMDEGTGTSAADSSGKNVTGTLVGAPSWIASTDISPAYKTGLGFNGTSQYMTTAFNSSTNFIASDKYTISAWVYLNQYQLPMSDGSSCCGSRIAYTNSPANGGFDWRIWNDGTLSFYRPTTWCSASSGNTKVPLNQWVNLTATYNNQQVYLYLNGNQVASKNNCNFLDATVGIKFNNPGGNHGLYGNMDDIRVYRRDLSGDEVKLLANKCL